MTLYPPRVGADSAFLGASLGALTRGAVGTAGTSIAALEMGEGTLRRTILKVTTPISVVTTPHSESLGDGILVYTFPAGQIILHDVYGDVGLEIDDASLIGDTPEVALGGTLTTGAVATVGASNVTDENIWGPHVAAGCDVGATVGDAGQWVSAKDVIIAAAADHTVYFNCAYGWSSGANTKDLFLQTGRFVIDWTLIPVEGV